MTKELKKAIALKREALEKSRVGFFDEEHRADVDALDAIFRTLIQQDELSYPTLEAMHHVLNKIGVWPALEDLSLALETITIYLCTNTPEGNDYVEKLRATATEFRRIVHEDEEREDEDQT